jgi:monoamine oxidase
MAKTPLFSRLRSLTAQSLHASAASSPVPLRRRQLLGYGLSASLLGCGPSTDPPVTTPSKRRVAVIGAGLAGLHCAYRLAQSMVDVTVYEANSRVGGRIFTGRRLFSDDKLSCELGGEFFESTDATLLALADELSIPIEERPLTSDASSDTYWARGAEVPETELLAALASVGPALLAALTAADRDDKSRRLLDNTRLDILLASSIPDRYPDLLRLMNAAFRAEFGLETEVLSGVNLWRLFPAGSASIDRLYGRAERRYRAVAGNDAFTGGLRERINSALVVTDRRLARIIPSTEGSFELTFLDQYLGGHRAEADHVVFALPFSVLRGIDLGALALTQPKRDAIAELAYGTAVKLVGAFTGKPWRTRYQKSGQVTSDLPFQTAWDSTRGPSQSASLLTNLFAGEAGRLANRTSVTDNMAATLADLDALWGPVSGDYIDGSAVRMHWPSSRYAAGSTSVYAASQYSRFGGREGTREGNLHFCGEHCSMEFKGTLEGAAETGALVAAEILTEFGIPLPEALKPLVRMKALLPQPGYGASSSQELGIGERRAIVARTHEEFAGRILPRLLSKR